MSGRSLFIRSWVSRYSLTIWLTTSLAFRISLRRPTIWPTGTNMRFLDCSGCFLILAKARPTAIICMGAPSDLGLLPLSQASVHAFFNILTGLPVTLADRTISVLFACRSSSFSISLVAASATCELASRRAAPDTLCSGRHGREHLAS